MNSKIKYLLTFALCSVAAFLLISVLPSSGEEKLYENVVRLHVIANSDSEKDQTVKLAVRDAVLSEISKMSVDSTDGASEYIEDKKAEITSLCNKVLEESGSSDTVHLEFGKENYPVRYYDSFALPAGQYTSLRVVIGEGEGKNWWCVLYPPLCTASSEAECEDEYLAAGFTGEEYRLIKKESGVKYKIKFKILEIIAETFGFDY